MKNIFNFLSLLSILFFGVAEIVQAEEINVSAESNSWALSAGESITIYEFSKSIERSIVLRRLSRFGSIAVEQLHLNRFSSIDKAIAIDAYPLLWSGAYGNIRYQKSSAIFYPNTSWRAEIFQNIGNGWELAASHDQLSFSSTVMMDGLSIGKYWGNFYARFRHQKVSSSVSSGIGNRFMIRYYYLGEADHFFEINASKGTSGNYATSQINGSQSDSYGVNWNHYLDRNWGFNFSASQVSDKQNLVIRERNIGSKLIYRW